MRDILIRSACNHAKSFINTPYVHQGRTPHSGLDCIGLITESYRYAGVNIDDLPLNYSHIPRPQTIMSNIVRYCHQVTFDSMQLGDIIVMRLRTHPQHLCLYVGENKIVHSYMSVGGVVEHELTKNYTKKIHSIYRLNNEFFI